MRQCLETRSLDQLGERLDQLENTRGEGVSYGTTKVPFEARGQVCFR